MPGMNINHFNLFPNYGNITPAQASAYLVQLVKTPATFYFQYHLDALLARGADSNAMVFDTPILHYVLAAHSSDIKAIQKLIDHGASLTALNSVGHNALSKAYELNLPKVIKLISANGGKFPDTMLKDPYYQGVDILLSKKNFTQADFKDIRCKNTLGEGLLHAAVRLNDAGTVKQVLKCGIDISLKNIFGQTALKFAKAQGASATESLKAIIDHKLQDHSDVLKMSDFNLYKAKGDGITTGGFYHDKANEKWLVKQGHSYTPEGVIKEYLAGGLYKLFLGENSSQTEIIIQDSTAIFMTGSKLLADFKTLSDHKGGFVWGQPAYGVDFPHTYKGKPVEGFMDAIAAINFMADTDAHSGNVGLIDHGDYFSFAKIDHGYSFHFNPMKECSLDNFRSHLESYYSVPLEKIGFEAVYQAVTNISNKAFETIEKTVYDMMDNAKKHMEVLELNAIKSSYDANVPGNLKSDLATYEDNLISNLKKQHQGYQKMADFMGLEKAIISHDWQALKNGISKGLSIETPFKPFYNPKYIHEWNENDTKSVTGDQLIKEHWPELMQLLKPGNNVTQSLTIHDLLVFDNPLDALLGSNNPEVKVQEVVPHLIPMHNVMAQFHPDVAAVHVEMAQF